MMARGGTVRVGTFSGSWRGAISIQCPDIDKQGIVVDQQPAPGSAQVRAL